MSKQSDAKAALGYMQKAATCATCSNLVSDRKLPMWMREENAAQAATEAPRWSESHAIEKGLRCEIGGFAVKKQSACRLHLPT